jgi:hypothetical protein
MATERIEDFAGVSREFHRARLPKQLFQVDEGGDHFEKKVWKVRRGHRTTTASKKVGKVATLIGFEAFNGIFAVLTVAGAVACGDETVIEQDLTEDDGYGVQGEGEGGV